MMRLLRGARAWWAVGTHQVARVPYGLAAADGPLPEAVVEALAEAELSPKVDMDTYHLTVMMTTACNLACGYCFQNVEVRPGLAPKRIDAVSLDEQTVDAILAFGQRQLAATGKSALDLMLFGGEPMLYLDQCVQLLGKASAIGLAGASMVSNATLLSEQAAQQLAAAGLSHMQISLDGDRADHDRSRVTRGGSGTFDQIMDNLVEASQVPGIDWELRINLTAANLAGIPALLGRLADRLDPVVVGVYFALIHDAGLFDDYVLPAGEVADLVAGFYRQVIDAGFTVPVPRDSIPCIACGGFAGATGAVVNSDGKLYSCWESAGKPGMQVGDIATGYLPAEVIAPRWQSCGYSATIKAEPSVTARYKDAVDIAVLDALYTAGRLGEVARQSRWASAA